MKKIIAIALSVVMIVSCFALFAACGGGSQKITLKILENDTAKKVGYLDYLLNAFNEKYKDQNVEAVDANMDEYADLENDGPYGYGPDVLYQANDALMKYVEKKHIIPLNVQEMEIYEQIPQNAWDAYKAEVDGQTVYCGIPVNVQQPLLFYRKDMLPDNWQTDWDDDKNGVPDMVEYWTEMYAYSKTIRDGYKTKYGIAMEMADEYFNSGFLFSYGAYVFGNNNTDNKDIGLSAGEAKLGGKIIWDLASVMDKKCVDDSFTKARDTLMADGTIFATISTPDTISSMITALANQYKKEGLSQEEATAKANENFVVAGLPKLPANGDITARQDVNKNELWIAQKTMGGVNGYAVSSYTDLNSNNFVRREWAIKFVEFATSKEMLVKRAEMLGIVPARADALAEIDDVASGIVFDNLDNGTLVVMPSISAVAQIWSPIATGFKKLAENGCTNKVMTLDEIQQVLEKIDTDIYNAIHTLG